MQIPKIVAIIQARTGSKRFPNKVLQPLAGVPMLVRVINAVAAVEALKPTFSNIVVATSDNKEDDAIEKLVNARNMIYKARGLQFKPIAVFRGSEEDVLKRYYDCAKQFSADIIVRVTGDCPFLSPPMVLKLIERYIETRGSRSYRALAFNRSTIPGGWDAEIFSFAELEYANGNSKNREHVTTDIRIKEDDIIWDLGTDFDFKDLKLDIDTKEDYERLREYAEYVF